MLQAEERIRAFGKEIDAIFKASEACQRIAKISGGGPNTATAMIAAVGDGSDFQKRPAFGRMARSSAFEADPLSRQV